MRLGIWIVTLFCCMINMLSIWSFMILYCGHFLWKRCFVIWKLGYYYINMMLYFQDGDLLYQHGDKSFDDGFWRCFYKFCKKKKQKRRRKKPTIEKITKGHFFVSIFAILFTMWCRVPFKWIAYNIFSF